MPDNKKNNNQEEEEKIPYLYPGLLFLALMMALLMGCTKNEFTVEFDLPADTFANYRLTYYAADRNTDGFWVQTAIPLDRGKFSLKGATRQPTILWLSDGGGRTIPIPVRRGETIRITGTEANPLTWTIDGDKLAKQWSEFRRQAWETSAKDSRKPHGNPTSHGPEYSGNLESDNTGTSAEAERIAAFVRKNPSEPLSALLLATEYPRKEKPSEFLKLWNSLDDKAERREALRMAASVDFDGSAFRMRPDGSLEATGAKTPRTLRLKTRGRPTAELRLGGSKRTLLAFENRSESTHRQTVDTLRSLRRLHPDSASHPLALVSFDSDSISWNFNLDRDTLPGVLRAWMPLGPADRGAMALGVVSTPHYIVLGPKGKTLYRGPDLDRAAKAFRKP